MREIKFEYILLEDNKFVDKEILTLEDIEQKNTNEFCYEILKENEKIIKRQFTGLLDKSGVEIYEGDVVYCNDVYYEVVWEVSKAVEFRITKQSERKYPDVCKQYFGFNANKHIEVIGNIYENKELLKEPDEES